MSGGSTGVFAVSGPTRRDEIAVQSTSPPGPAAEADKSQSGSATSASGRTTTLNGSGCLLVSRFGPNVRTTVRLGVTWNVVVFIAFMLAFGGAVAAKLGLAHGSPVGVAGLRVATIGAFAVVAALTIYSAVQVYLSTVLFRYATGQPTPGILAGALPWVLKTPTA